MEKWKIVLAVSIIQIGLLSGCRADEVRFPIIDVHQHANGLTPKQAFSPPPILCVNDRVPCDNPPSQYRTNEDLLLGTLEYMERFNIVKAVLSGSPREIERWTNTAGDRFLVGAGGILGGPEHLRLDSLRASFEQGEYDLLGEIGNQYVGIPPNDESLDPYFALAEEMDIPVLIHTLGIGARIPSFRTVDGNPLLLEEVLQRHPRLRLYVENAGYPFLDEMVAILYMYPQVYVDVSTITWLIPRDAFQDYLQRLVVAGFSDRIMFGSDQMSWPETIEMAIESIDSANFLTPEQKRDIFFNNAVRFFRLDPEALREASW